MEIQNSMMTRDFLKSYIDAAKYEIFTEVHAPNADDAETLGILIAKYFKWDGALILDAMQAALEDANFHSFNAKIDILRQESEV